MIRNKFLFYFLSFTWGLPITLLGCVTALLLLITGHKLQKWGYCYYFEVGNGWGGVSLGPIFVVNKQASRHTKNHESGHSHQNCAWGLLFPFVIAIPSCVRYWYREIRARKGNPCASSYYSVWFEKEASEIGTDFIHWYKNNTK